MDLKEYFNLKSVKGRYQTAIAKATAEALQSFCYQEQEFQQAIEQSGKSFQNCLDEVVKGIKGSVSDFEVYSRAVKFYFPGAKVRFRMEIDLIGNADAPVPAQKEPRKLSAVFDSLADW
ncbi:MAG: hypothetical protein K2H89_11200 [Oscillospiraceae bacterium]|nr:hypothetical protein [Oscillospiraceae bacterium]